MQDTLVFGRIHYYFTMLSLSHAFVTDSNGWLRGVITKVWQLELDIPRIPACLGEDAALARNDLSR